MSDRPSTRIRISVVACQRQTWDKQPSLGLMVKMLNQCWARCREWPYWHGGGEFTGAWLTWCEHGSSQAVKKSQFQ
eukprot:6207805-Pleurochrysis_carterae.AAC.2